MDALTAASGFYDFFHVTLQSDAFFVGPLAGSELVNHRTEAVKFPIPYLSGFAWTALLEQLETAGDQPFTSSPVCVRRVLAINSCTSRRL